MNNFKILITISKFSWFVAIALMLVTWIQMWNSGFANIHYIIEDKFIYIGILGGWLFIWFLYFTIILFAGYFILKLINIIADNVNCVEEEQ